ncbi:hypothetical protein R5W23_000454 [Gemmata sp. JC673]|uniref:HEAT repeat domain-containing protein n=1 Tax=Gemmata algarum TaxID=2975278 RepID=A0ABU5EVY2_9BACT|nr:hypothetical protein [Gemmata algarum]MDY3559461.1 hypothetical protein [Gemmata algarum]
MIRYRCPHCSLLTAAHERRIGQASVCKACLRPHQIPADSALWLTETGDSLYPDAAPVPSQPAPVVEREDFHESQLTAPAQPQPAPVAEREDFHEPQLTAPELAPERVPVPSLVHTPETEPVREPESEPVAEVTEVDPHEEPEPVAAPVRVVLPPAPVPALEEEPERAAVGTTTPPPQPAWVPAPAPVQRIRPVTPSPHESSDTPAPRYAEPVQLQTQADIAAALTNALTARMKPRAAPRRDLRPSTALWMLLTGLGVAFFFAALFTGAANRWVVLVAGALQIALGYAWIVRLTAMRSPLRGRLCAIPVVTPYYLFQQKYAKLRPLRFVLTGCVLVVLSFAVPAVADLTTPLVPKAEPRQVPPDLSTQPVLTQLRTYRERSDYGGLVRTLGLLAKSDTIHSVDARDRAEIAVELEALCKHEDRTVRLGAMAALVSWDTTPNNAKARQVCLDAIRSPSEEERYRALCLLSHWKDAETARAAQSLIGRPNRQTNQAKQALEEIGGPHAEAAALVLLKRADDLTVRLIAIDILLKVGGPTAGNELEQFAQATDDIGARNSALSAVNQIRGRKRP